MSFEDEPAKKVARRRPFTLQEDAALMLMMTSRHDADWDSVAERMDGRTARQCRERWCNYLAPTVRTDPWTDCEDRMLVARVNELGHSWATISHFLNGRSENDVKNRWYSHLKFRCICNPATQQLFLAPHECNLFPDRRTRKRPRPKPQQNAIRLIEEEKRAPEAQLPAANTPPIVAFQSPFAMTEEGHEFPDFFAVGIGFDGLYDF